MALRNRESTLQLHINSNGAILQKRGIKRIYDVELKAALHKQTWESSPYSSLMYM